MTEPRPRRGNARRRDWALCHLDRTVVWRLSFDTLAYRWVVEAQPAGAAPPAGAGAPAGRPGDRTADGAAPPA